VLGGCSRGAWRVGPEDRYHNPKPQYTHSLIKIWSHTPETPRGSVDIHIYIYIYIYI